MRISIVGPVYPYRGGISHYTALLARAAREAGHATQVVSFRRQYPAWLYPGETDKDPSHTPLRTEATFLLDPLYPWTWVQAARQVRSFAPNVVVLQWWTTFWGPGLAALSRQVRRPGCKRVFLIHNVLPHEQHVWDRPLARLALAQGDAFVTQTASEVERLRRLIPQAEIHPFRHPDYRSLLPAQRISRSEARRQLDLVEDEFVLLFFGFVRKYKGVEVLLRALGRLRTQGVTPRLVIAGEFWEDKQRYLDEIERLGLQAQVRLADHYIPDEEIGVWYTAADCLVAPYTAGTQSGAAAIALAHGLPMIVSTQVAEGLPSENRGARLAVTPPGDVEALAAAIQRAMSQPGDAPLQRDCPITDDWQQLVSVLTRIAAGGNAADGAGR